MIMIYWIYDVKLWNDILDGFKMFQAQVEINEDESRLKQSGQDLHCDPFANFKFKIFCIKLNSIGNNLEEPSIFLCGKNWI